MGKRRITKVIAAGPATYVILIVAIALSQGCSDRRAATPEPPPAAGGGAPAGQPEATSSPDQWLGQWNGPEGTFLKLSKSESGYAIIIQNLDGPTTYQGTSAGDHIEFERQGKVESIRATNGKDTGMKWLQDKTNCLTINPGEGYCRD